MMYMINSMSESNGTLDLTPESSVAGGFWSLCVRTGFHDKMEELLPSWNFSCKDYGILKGGGSKRGT